MINAQREDDLITQTLRPSCKSSRGKLTSGFDERNNRN
jgi:hypothetical protein